MNLLSSTVTFLSCVLTYYILNVANNTMATAPEVPENVAEYLPNLTEPTSGNIINEAEITKRNPIIERRNPVKLTMKQGLLMNQVLGTYALSNLKNSLCKNHTEEFKQGLRAFEPWALQMFDSSSKVQSGVLSGNLVEYGAFRQCLNIHKHTVNGAIMGKHCSFKIIPGTSLVKTILSFRNVSEKRFEKVKIGVVEGVELVWSVCVPHSCTAHDVFVHYNKSIMEITDGLDLSVVLNEEHCATLENQPKLTLKHYCFLLTGTAVVLTVVICSLIEAKGSANKFTNAFSVISNGQRLIAKSKNNSELDCLHGIRFISVCYVMFGHRFMTGMLFPAVNSLDLLDWILKYTSTVIIGGTVCVDSFLLVSGTLVCYVFFERITKTKRFNLFLFYIHRYIRITPPLAVAVIVYSSFIQFFGSGPIWYDTYIAMQKPCQVFWWSTLLHIQSYVNPKYLCIAQTWYLTCDTLYYYFAPAIMYPLWKWPSFGLANLFVFYILSVSTSFYLAWVNRYVGGMPLTQQLFHNKYFQKHYIVPHTRAPPYIIGLAFGYALFKTKETKINMSFGLNFAGWCLTIIFMSSAVVGSHVFQEEGHDYNRLESSLFLALSRSAWVLGIVWIIWACTHGYGGIVNSILSLHIFRILGRIGYGIFLFHMSLQFLKDGAGKAPGYYSNWFMLYNCAADLVIMIIVGTLFTLCFEYPFMGLEGILLRNKGRIGKVESQPVQGKLEQFNTK